MCSLSGTIDEMKAQAKQIEQRMEEHATKVLCQKCFMRKRLGFEISAHLNKGVSQFVCYECQEEARKRSSRK
jgi:superfamily II helicase